jgi:hypothetical protein
LYDYLGAAADGAAIVADGDLGITADRLKIRDPGIRIWSRSRIYSNHHVICRCRKQGE